MPQETDTSPLKVWFICTGTGIFNRGIESFFREAFDGLHPLLPAQGIHVQFFKGGGVDVPPDEHRVRCLPRTGTPAKLFARLMNRTPYVAEQLSFLPGIIRRIRAGRPDVLLFSDGNMGMRLWSWRRRIGVPYKMIYSNGAPLQPPFTGVDHVQQVVPLYYEEAMAAGESAGKHSLVPYGFSVPAGEPMVGVEAKLQARRELGLPIDRPIVLSVGWIAKSLKRMDYTINEIASMPDPKPYLVMLGAMDDETPPMLALANEKLGPDNFTARSVPLQLVTRYYQAADVFALASIREGFGRVYIEAMIHGLPVLAHDGPVTRFVLDDQGIFADLTRPGNMASALGEMLKRPLDPQAAIQRRESVRQRFSWQVLAPKYAAMFKAAMR